MPDGSVILVEIERHTLMWVTPDGSKTIVAELGGGRTVRRLARTAAAMSATTAASRRLLTRPHCFRLLEPTITAAVARSESTLPRARSTCCTRLATSAP